MTLPFAFKMRNSARARSLRLLVRPTGVEVVVPRGLPETSVFAFLKQHSGWVLKKQAEMALRVSSQGADFEPPALISGARIPWGDGELVLDIQCVTAKHLQVDQHGSALRIRLPHESSLMHEHLVRQGIFLWAKARIKSQVEEMLACHVGRYSLIPRHIRVKNMRTRWGSCGPQNDLNLNWLLALSPTTVLEYVVVHEICHIRHRDHSLAFWSLLAEHLPQWQSERAWLKKHGPELMRRYALSPN